MAWEAWQIEIAMTKGKDLTVCQLADEIGKAPQTIKKYMDANQIPYVEARKAGTTYSDEQVIAVQNMLKDGKKQHEVAAAMGFSRSFVNAVAKGERKPKGDESPKRVAHKHSLTEHRDLLHKVFS